jgi:hypothetical protein
MRGLEPAGAHDMRDPQSIVGISLVALRRHRGADMAGFPALLLQTFTIAEV